MDIIWESVGGDMFRACLRALAQGGRLIVIGMMSQYSSGWKQVCLRLLILMEHGKLISWAAHDRHMIFVCKLKAGLALNIAPAGSLEN